MTADTGLSALAGEDPLDSRFVPVASRARRAGLLLVVVGFALGPEGLNILSANILRALEPAMPVVLAALGVLAGQRLDLVRTGIWRIAAGAASESLLVAAIVGAGVFAATRVLGGEAGPLWLAALLGVCAAASDAGSVGTTSSVSRRIDLTNAAAILLAALLLGFVNGMTWAEALESTLRTAALGGVVALSTWLLVSQAASDGEQRVFAAGALLLLGGFAEYLGLSALFAGLVAGLCWVRLGGAAGERLDRDMHHIQHPLAVVLLLYAGARLEIGPAVAPLAAAYVVCRTVAKLASGSIARRQLGQLTDQVGLAVMPAGALGIAIAVDAFASGISAATMDALAAIVFGTLGSELLALMHAPRPVVMRDAA